MKSITIGFSRSRKILPIGSWLIRLYQKTSYSHVYIKFYSESLNRALIYEAVGSGVRFIGTRIWEKHAEEVFSYTFKIKECNSITTLQSLVDDAGLDYGFLQNVGIFLADILGWKSNPWKKGRNCSEVVGKLLKSEGFVVDKPLDLLTPKDIHTILKNQVKK